MVGASSWVSAPPAGLLAPALHPARLKPTGLGRTFAYPFPRDVQRLLFSSENGADSSIISAKDSEGIDVTIACSLQYSLKRERGDLEALFARYGSLVPNVDDPEAPDAWGWTPFFIQHTRGIVRDVMADYNATSLWRSRSALAADMRTALGAKLDSERAVLRGFQLLNMDIPVALQEAILSTTVEQEAVKRARENLRAINETVITDVAVQSRLAEIDLLIAQADAREVSANAQAANQSLRLQVGAEVDAVNSLKASLNLNTTEYLSLLYMDTVATAGADSVNVGVTQPANTQG